MRRRDFISTLAGAAVALPFTGRAQQTSSIRNIAVVIGTQDDAEGQARLAALADALGQLGWQEGRNVHLTVRYTAGSIDLAKTAAVQVTASLPDIIVANTNPVVLALKEQTRDIPIVFAQISDPLSTGIVDSLSHPGGNVTGFSSAEFSITTKCLEILRDLVPGLQRIGTLRDPSSPASMGQVGAL